MRNKVIAGNWKMHKTLEEANQFLDEIKGLKTEDHVTAVVCAPFIHLTELVNKAKGTDIKIAAQNMHYEESGAFTGEVSPSMLQNIGVTHVVIGHSERREYFNETDDTVNKKVLAAFDHNLIPIVCVGETLEQRESGDALSLIEQQVNKALASLQSDQVEKVILAYEPIWAIGTGKTASSEDANEVCAHIRQTVKSLAGEQAAEKIVIQYGGSVKPANIDELLATSDIDGALVGGASLEPESFSALVEAGNKTND